MCEIFASFPAKILSKLRDQQHKPGLYVVATPIGNIFDISLRALYILSQSKRIFAEDTRQSGKLLKFYGLEPRLVCCHEHNELSVTRMIAPQEIYSLISDAGTPLISDPGYRLLNWCLQNSVDVFPIPGACSPICALSISGLPTDKFMFAGFLAPRGNSKIAQLRALKDQSATLIFLEAPTRVVDTLKKMEEIFGNRYACICRELTKFFEETKRGTLVELYDYFSQKKPTGEFIIVVAGNCVAPLIDEAELTFYLKNALQTSLKDAVRETSEKFGVNKNIIYQMALALKKNTGDDNQ
ncbi:MAG: 16S rRNA (cytidine(1402)-2'-O)-methyltransferase [Holosporaceae bacterium]|nr:16S rRNA (cytidine(1402)-2'-O)-methyltransferase [Holosporaceae bacterium]